MTSSVSSRTWPHPVCSLHRAYLCHCSQGSRYWNANSIVDIGLRARARDCGTETAWFGRKRLPKHRSMEPPVTGGSNWLGRPFNSFTISGRAVGLRNKHTYHILESLGAKSGGHPPSVRDDDFRSVRDRLIFPPRSLFLCQMLKPKMSDIMY